MASRRGSAASITTKYEVEGLRELEQALDKLGFEVAANELREELVSATAYLASEVAAAAPVDEGDLKRAIGRRSRISKSGRGRIAVVRVGVLKGRKAEVNQTAIAQEYGTSNHAAQPFLRPTFRKRVPHILSTFRSNMWARVRRIRAANAR